MLSSDIGHSKSVMRCSGWLQRAPAQFARLHCRKRAFEIRLRSGPSFREKLRQLSVKPNDERRAQHIGKSAIADPPKIRIKERARSFLTGLLIFSNSCRALALRELERLACFRPTVLLALHRAGVAGEEAALLQHATQLGLEIGERLGDAVTHRAGLARQAAAGNRADHV